MSDKEFIELFNNYYPLRYYIIKLPKVIGTPFNDLMLTEIFKSENPKQLYIMVKSKHDEIRLNYYDFASHIREEIRGIILEDFSNYCW